MTTFTTRITAMYTVQQPDPNYVINAIKELKAEVDSLKQQLASK
jgi:hypothetical protein